MFTGFIQVKLEQEIMIFTFGGLGIWYIIDLIIVAVGQFKKERRNTYSNIQINSSK